MNTILAQSPLSDHAFEAITGYASEAAGLHFPPSKRAFVFSRLQKRLRELKLPDFEAYCTYIFTDTPEADCERNILISRLTTNVTHFFREKHHFDHMAQHVLPRLRARAALGAPLRIWSAGCSTGQEPYSILLMLMSEAPDLLAGDLRMLATDIDPVVLRHAIEGRYRKDDIPADKADLFAQATEPVGPDEFRFVQDFRNRIRFRLLNLIEPWPFHGPFDVIFCRNVVIYFDSDTQHQVILRLEQMLAPGATLFLGHSERPPTDETLKIRNVGLTTYERIHA